MGRSYRQLLESSPRALPTTMQKSVTSVDSLIKDFFNTKKVKKLIDAFKQYSTTHQEGFIREVYTVGEKTIEKEFPDWEYELKFEVIVAKASLLEIIEAIEFPPTNTASFIKDATNTESKGVNHFYGTDEDERFVITEKGGKFYLKQKGLREILNYGIEGENLILKRRENKIEINPLEIANIMIQKYADGKTKNQGKLDKERIDAHLLNTSTGRIYSLTVDNLAREDKKSLKQLEVEYSGIIPGFSASINDEKTIASDLTAIAKHITYFYKDVKLPNGERLRLVPSQTTKYDFVRGQKTVEQNNLDSSVETSERFDMLEID